MCLSFTEANVRLIHFTQAFIVFDPAPCRALSGVESAHSVDLRKSLKAALCMYGLRTRLLLIEFAAKFD